MNTYDTMLEALQGLEERGYNREFHFLGDCLGCYEVDKLFAPEDFEIVEVHRFEGYTNPSDNSVLYAVEGVGGVKGVLLDAYGAYADELSPELLKKLGRANRSHAV